MCKKNKCFSVFLVVICMVAILSFVGYKQAECAEIPKEIKVGVILPLTGPVAAYMFLPKQGIEMLFDEHNEKANIKFIPVWADDKGDPSTSVSEAERLITLKKVSVILGCGTSACTYAVSGVCEKYGIPLIVTAFAENITQQGYKNVFRGFVTTSPYINSISEFIMDNMKIDRVAHIYEDGMWGTSNADNSRKWFEENSPDTKIVFWEGYNKKPPIDLSSSVLKLKNANPDLLICSSYLADAIALLETMHELNCYIPNMVGIGGGFVDPKLIEEVGNLVKGACVACLWSSDITTPKAAAFTEAYYKKYGLYPTGDTGAFAVNVEVLFNALEKAKSIDPEKIREALVDTDMEDSIAGYPVKFAENGDNIYASAFVTQIIEIDGKLKWSTVYPSKLATNELETPMLPYDKR